MCGLRRNSRYVRGASTKLISMRCVACDLTVLRRRCGCNSYSDDMRGLRQDSGGVSCGDCLCCIACERSSLQNRYQCDSDSDAMLDLRRDEYNNEVNVGVINSASESVGTVFVGVDCVASVALVRFLCV